MAPKKPQPAPEGFMFFSQRARVIEPFSKANGEAYTYGAKVNYNIFKLIDGLKKYTDKASVNTPEAEEDIQRKFTQFLIGCEFNMAITDFQELLAESDLSPRDDGSTAWHHQFSQVLLFLDQIKRGKISVEQLEEQGGLEVCIRTILRHDSIEDFGKNFQMFKAHQEANIEKRFDELVRLGLKDKNDPWRTTEYRRLDALMINLRLMSKKTVKLDDDGNPIFNTEKGKFEKEDLFPNDIAFIGNMLDDPEAKPTVWLFKTNDGSHNMGNMLMAPKFDAMSRKKYCNRREDMYGGRHGFPERAQAQWPDFADAAEEADDLMGAILFTNFGFLSHVDQEDAYPLNPKYEGGEIYPLGITKYMKGALAYQGPRAFNPLHNLLDDIQSISHDGEHPERAFRAQLYLQHAVKPALYDYKHHFPKLFNDPTIGAPSKPDPDRKMPS